MRRKMSAAAVSRLKTGLVQSIPKIRPRLDRQSVEYRPVKSPTGKEQLWLPSSTELYMDFQGRRFYRKHSSTDFKMFSVDSQYHVAERKKSLWKSKGGPRPYVLLGDDGRYGFNRGQVLHQLLRQRMPGLQICQAVV